MSSESDPDNEEISEKKGLIYKFEGPLNIPEECKIYIGMTTTTLSKRRNKHKTSFKRWCDGLGRSCTYLFPAMKEYGFDNFKMSILEDDILKSDLDSREIYWINELNTLHPNGYNNQTGGKHGSHNKETRSIISRAGRQTEKSKRLPEYIYDYEDYQIPENPKHGYKVKYGPSGKCKFFLVPMSEEIPDSLLKEAKEYLADHIIRFENGEFNNHDSDDEDKEIPNPLPEYMYETTYTCRGRIVHGFRFWFKPTGKQGCNTFPIDKPITYALYKKVKTKLDKVIADYEASLVNSMENLNL